MKESDRERKPGNNCTWNGSGEALRQAAGLHPLEQERARVLLQRLGCNRDGSSS
jgi:hypothetical protein